MAFLARTFPLTLTLLAVVLVVGLITGAIGRAHFETMVKALGFDLGALKHGRLYLLPLGPLIQDKPGLPWKMLTTVALFVGPLEFVARSLRTAITYFITDFFSTVGATFLLWGLAALGFRRAEEYVQTADLGSSSAAFGCAAAFAAMLPGKWPLLVAGGLSVYLLPSLYITRHVFAVEHVIAALVGFCLGFLWRRTQWKAEVDAVNLIGVVADGKR